MKPKATLILRDDESTTEVEIQDVGWKESTRRWEARCVVRPVFFDALHFVVFFDDATKEIKFEEAPE